MQIKSLQTGKLPETTQILGSEQSMAADGMPLRFSMWELPKTLLQSWPNWTAQKRLEMVRHVLFKNAIKVPTARTLYREAGLVEDIATRILPRWYSSAEGA